MLALILATAIFGIDNKEFIDTSSKQLKEGYSWTYVGKQKPEGVPALTLKSNGDEYILWKLK
jgi:hypothetical protein|tara:strand:- start:918 stop:1103 length:186 start_codon:yes stop_codon:yes gene_type:complete